MNVLQKKFIHLWFNVSVCMDMCNDMVGRPAFCGTWASFDRYTRVYSQQPSVHTLSSIHYIRLVGYANRKSYHQTTSRIYTRVQVGEFCKQSLGFVYYRDFADSARSVVVFDYIGHFGRVAMAMYQRHFGKPCTRIFRGFFVYTGCITHRSHTVGLVYSKGIAYDLNYKVICKKIENVFIYIYIYKCMVIVSRCRALFCGLLVPIVMVNNIDLICSIAVNDRCDSYVLLEMLAVFATRATTSAFLYYGIFQQTY